MRNRDAWLTTAVLVASMGAALLRTQDPAPEVVAEQSDPAAASLSARIDELRSWVKEGKGKLSLRVLDVETGQRVAGVDDELALNPASNMKVVTAAAALELLGPDFSFRTGVYGDLNDTHSSSLVLRGDGDPSFGMGDVWRLASALVQSGLRQVDGDVLVDQSRFDGQYVPPAFDQQPNEWAYFRAPVSAVALDENTVTLNVVPTAPGKPARIWFDPPGFVNVSGHVRSDEQGKGQSIQLRLAPDGNKLRADLDGHIADGLPRQRFSKRVDDPTLLAGFALAHALESLGVEIKGKVKPGGSGEKRELVHVSSAPLNVLVQRLGKDSDNFYAEMVFKAIAAHANPGEPSTFKQAAVQVSEWLAQVTPEGSRTAPAPSGSAALGGSAAPAMSGQSADVILNGSGLFDANRLSAATLTRVLSHAYRDPRLSAEFVAQLSIGGVDGTLRSRLRNHRKRRVVRAKTGTLARVVALSGFVLRDGKEPYAFSILVNGIADHAGVRRRMDRVVDALVSLSEQK
ncbi:MAG: D-alanyl-D-alanine carboxypeptidase/D-alanyl-D-alanine-endopeptidase [Myxococcales bacterium]|nr:D-alanyl-D-alanine carboxypeptidase/D-alanyl-D-alanine-endopeptidase [Myxococcales bacterium]